MQTTTTLLHKEKAELLAAQNTADDGAWTYKAEPVTGNNANLFQVVIYDEEDQKVGTL